MKYYRVKKECDQVTRYIKKERKGGKIAIVSNGILIGGELYTENAFAILANSEKCFDVVEIPKTKTYWFFGARFESK